MKRHVSRPHRTSEGVIDDESDDTVDEWNEVNEKANKQ